MTQPGRTSRRSSPRPCGSPKGRSARPTWIGPAAATPACDSRVEALLAAHARADDILGPAGATSAEGPATAGHDPDVAEAIGPTSRARPSTAQRR